MKPLYKTGETVKCLDEDIPHIIAGQGFIRNKKYEISSSRLVFDVNDRDRTYVYFDSKGKGVFEDYLEKPVSLERIISLLDKQIKLKTHGN